MTIKVYSQPSCPQCRMVKTLLDKKGLEYQVCEDIEEMKDKGIMHTPTLEVDGHRYVAKPMMDKIKEL